MSDPKELDPLASALLTLLDLVAAETEDPATKDLCQTRFKLAEIHGYTVSYYGPGLTSSEIQ